MKAVGKTRQVGCDVLSQVGQSTKTIKKQSETLCVCVMCGTATCPACTGRKGRGTLQSWWGCGFGMDHSRVQAVVWLAKLAWVLLNWSLREGQNSYSASSCRAATLVTHSHELVIRNVSSHEEVSGSGLLDRVSSLLMLFIRDRWLSHAESSLLAFLALNWNCARAFYLSAVLRLQAQRSCCLCGVCRAVHHVLLQENQV